MQKRQEQLLEIIINYYIETAQPVGSKLISESSELENQGFILQPHTSAGRIPTEKGYLYYVEKLIKIKPIDKKTQKYLKGMFSDERPLKNLAKGVAENSHLAVFLGYEDKDYFYTGLSNLFGQPEFFTHELVYDISEVVDHLDEVIYNIFDEVFEEPQIFIGSNNPFGKFCSTVLAKFKSKKRKGLLGILGPTRMDYQNNLALIKYSRDLIKNL